MRLSFLRLLTKPETMLGGDAQQTSRKENEFGDFRSGSFLFISRHDIYLSSPASHSRLSHSPLQTKTGELSQDLDQTDQQMSEVCVLWCGVGGVRVITVS